jgi:hypothetical protein
MSKSFINTEAGGRTLFDLTFGGTLSLLPTWEDQPETFKQTFREKAEAVAIACETDSPWPSTLAGDAEDTIPVPPGGDVIQG